MADLLSTILGIRKGEEVRDIYIDDIVENPAQPRKVFDEEALQELAKSIKEFGVIQPIIVRRKGAKYELVCGERRLRASKIAKLEKIPAIVRRLSDEESMELCLIENLQRKDLNPIEEANVYLKLIRDLKLTQKEVSEKVGKSPLFISNMMKLLRLPDEIKENVSRETISKGHCFALLQLQEKSLQLEVLKEIKEKSLSVKQTEELVEKLKKRKAKKEKKPDTLEAEKEVKEQLNIFQKIINMLKKRKKPVEMSKTETDDYIEIKVIIQKNKKKISKEKVKDQEIKEEIATMQMDKPEEVEKVEIKEPEKLEIKQQEDIEIKESEGIQ